MSRFPDTSVGVEADADLLTAMIPDIYVKQTGEPITSDSTLSADSELSNIALPVGTFWVKLVLMWTDNTSATPDIKTQWGFSGTWNNPIRACIGPGVTNTAARTDVTPSQFNGVPSATNAVYGSPASTGFNVAKEECFTVVVTVAGNLSLQWAQNTSDASTTQVQAGSAFMIKQIA